MPAHVSDQDTQPRLFKLNSLQAPASGVKVKIWQCLDIPAQRWSYAADNRFELDGTSWVVILRLLASSMTYIFWLWLAFVLDLTDGNLGNWNQLQIWTRTPNNPNQVWSTY